METLSNLTVLLLLDCRPPCPVPMAKAVVPVAARVPLIHNFRVTGPEPVTSNLAVNQVFAAITALPVVTVLKVAAVLFQ